MMGRAPGDPPAPNTPGGSDPPRAGELALPNERASRDEPEKYRTLRRGLRSRRRDDAALDLFRRAEANLGDVKRVERILLELGRCYNPLTNGPILGFESRRMILGHLQAGRVELARGVLDEALTSYARVEQPTDLPAPGAADDGRVSPEWGRLG
jgi:hypothetical protein